MAFYFALYSVSCINLEEHAAKRYQQIKNNQTDKETKKESTDKPSKFQFFKKNSKKKNKNDNVRKPKTNKRPLNIEDIVIGDFPTVKDEPSPLISCPSISKNDHAQHDESKIRRHSSSSGEKRVTFNKSKKVGQKKRKAATTKNFPLCRPHVIRSTSENEDFLDDEVFSANYYSDHYGHRRRNACEFSNEEFGSFEKYPWNMIGQAEIGSEQENTVDFDPIMVKTFQPSKQKMDDHSNSTEYHSKNFNAGMAKLKKSVGQLVCQQKLKQLIAHWTTLSHHNLNHNGPDHRASEQSKASTSCELSPANVKDNVPHLHKNIREISQSIRDSTLPKIQTEIPLKNLSRPPSKIMTLRRKMAKPLDKLRKFSSPTKFATILETSFDNDADDQTKVVIMPIDLVSPIIEKIEINYQQDQQVKSPRLQCWIGRKASHPLDTVSRFKTDVDTKSL